MSVPGGYGGYQDQQPHFSGGGYGPQGSYPPQGGNFNAPPTTYNPQGSYGAPPTNYQPHGSPGGPYGSNSGYSTHPSASLKGMSVGGNINDIFFGAACCIVLGAFLSGFVLFFTLALVDFIQVTYLMIFGGILAILDTPLFKTIKAVMDAKMYIGKYLQFVTRVTGKGVTLVFLGSALFMTMWHNLEGWFFKVLTVVLCFFPMLVGFGAIIIGILKSSKLDKARRQVQMVINDRYAQYAQTHPGPQGGLTMQEFSVLTLENGNFRFEPFDLKLIFAALVSNPSWRAQPTSTQGGYVNANDNIKLPKQDLLDWCKGGFVFL